jgi:hypothetical protein
LLKLLSPSDHVASIAWVTAVGSTAVASVEVASNTAQAARRVRWRFNGMNVKLAVT